ncbi:hypothetical protein HDU97_004155 [Phlyctochytrium planicorne]|nr:hypothetical protein HDU97_004155 [Phlyctochytrium planicorne]
MSKVEQQPLLEWQEQPQQQSIQVPADVPPGSTIVVVPPNSVVRIKRRLSPWIILIIAWKTISVETFSGIIHVSNIVDADLIHIATQYGLSSIQGLETKNLDITSGGPPITLSSSRITNNLAILGTYEIDVVGVSGKPQSVNISLQNSNLPVGGSIRLRFYGDFSVKAEEGYVIVKGDRVEFSINSNRIKEGKRGADRVSFLEVEFGKGSPEVYFEL